MNRHYLRFASFTLALFCAFAPTGPRAWAAAGQPAFLTEAESYHFAPHKALYDIRLSGTKNGSQIVDIRGQMLYVWQPTCDAWVSKHQFTLNYEYADSPSMRISSDFSTYEPFDGQSMNFVSQRRRNGELFEELRGQASVNDARAGAAVYTVPRGLEFNLPAGSLFPMGHTLNVLKAIQRGDKFYRAVIFDGSDDDGPVEVNAFLGKKDGAPDQIHSKDIDSRLLASPRHAVRLAFFPLKDPKDLSDYEMNLDFHENGVIGDMEIEYGDFSVTQKLVALQALPDSCPARGEVK